jgi:hypothetical protein
MEKNEFEGKWRVVEAPDMADDYLSLSEDPHILIEVERDKCASGSYQFGAQDGNIDGRFEKDCKGNPQLTFTFEGCDEMDPVSGYGTASIESPGNMLMIMRYHLGDAYTYRCRRD